MTSQTTKSSSITPTLRFPGFVEPLRKYKLIDLARIYDGTHQTPQYVKAGVPFYSVEHLTANNFSDTKYVSELVYENESKKVKLETNDILMTRIGDIGTAKLIDWDVKASYYVSLALIKSSSVINSPFLSKYISSSKFQKELWTRTIHVAFPKKINLGEIGQCELIIPETKEQNKIANFISTVDSWLENLKSQKSFLEAYKKSIMQKIFTQEIRFKDESGNEYPEWEDKILGEISVNYDSDRKPISSEKRISGIYPYYGANGIADYVKDYIFDGEYVLVAEDGVVDTSKYPIHYVSGKFWANNHAHVLKGKGVSTIFLFYALANTKFMKYITGSAQTKLNGQVLKKIIVDTPCIEEQNKIASSLLLLDKNIKSKQNQITEVELWKKGLMQQMFV